MDIINGPKDHGQCSSYACLKRMSLFMLAVADKQNFLFYPTSTTPQRLRLRFPKASPDYAVRIGIDFSAPGRHDVYVDGKLIEATNADKNKEVNYLFIKCLISTVNTYV